MLNEIFRKSNEIYKLRKNLKRKINEKLAEMELYGYSRVRVETDNVEIRFQKKLFDSEIKTLEKEFNLVLLSYEEIFQKNINNNPKMVFCAKGESLRIYKYTFGGDNYGN